MAQPDTAITQAAEALIDAFNHADWDRIRPLLTSDVVYAETGTGQRAEGADAYFELLDGWKAASSDLTGTIRNVVASDDTVAQEILWEGTHTGPLSTPSGILEPIGEHFVVVSTVWYHFDGGLIREMHHHIDLLTILQQLGALPAPAQ